MRSVLLLLLLSPLALAADAPKISADLGPCSADFHVTSTDAKPIYNARVHTLIRYGAFGMRKLDLEVRTDSNGQARVVNLPELAKKAITFDISSGALSTTQPYDPGMSCHAKYEIVLK